jgi:hypothetical protein
MSLEQSPQLTATNAASVSKEKQGRRKSPRRALNRKVGFLYLGDYHILQGIDVGEGGIGLIVDHKNFVENTNVLVSFQVPGGNFVFIKGTLMPHQAHKTLKNKNIYGVVFSDIEIDQRRLIRNYVTGRKD